jgi:hypothetical protein
VTWRPPEPLAVHHRLEGFDCTKPTLNHWLQHHARQAQTSGSARTFVVADQENRVAAYFSLTVGQVDTVKVRFRNRRCFTGAMVLGNEVLLGAIAMEDMDLVLRPQLQSVDVNPESPNIPLSLAK